MDESIPNSAKDQQTNKNGVKKEQTTGAFTYTVRSLLALEQNSTHVAAPRLSPPTSLFKAQTRGDILSSKLITRACFFL